MVKSAMSQIVKDSAKLDLDEWVRGGKPRTATVVISNDPDLAEQIDDLAVRMNALYEQIQESDPVESSGIADDDPRQVEWAALKAEYDALNEEYEASKLSFVFRSQRPDDVAEIEAELKAAGVKLSDESRGVALVAKTALEPAMTYESLTHLLTVLGSDAFLPMSEAVRKLAGKRKEPTAPLSLRP